jgi:hypothetical protein
MIRMAHDGRIAPDCQGARATPHDAAYQVNSRVSKGYASARGAVVAAWDSLRNLLTSLKNLLTIVILTLRRPDGAAGDHRTPVPAVQ